MSEKTHDRPGPKDEPRLGVTEGQREAGVVGSLRSSISSDAARGPGLTHSAEGPLGESAEARGTKQGAKAKAKEKRRRTPGSAAGHSRTAASALDRRDEKRLDDMVDKSMAGAKTFSTSRSVDPEDELLAEEGSHLPSKAGSARNPKVRPENPGLPDFRR